jgi:hypothetical protein
MNAPLVVLTGLLLVLQEGKAAISVQSLGGSITFDTLPATAEWSTRSIPGTSASIASAAALDAAAQTNSASGITDSLLVDSGSVSPQGRASWSSTGQFVHTGPAGVAYNLLLATLQNDTAGNIAYLHIGYDFSVIPAVLGSEEVPGQRVYYSVSGLPGSWQLIPQLSGVTTAGPLDIWLPLGSWPPGALLYVLWAQDNAAQSPDASYAIDDFYASTVICDSFIFQQPFANLTVSEGAPARFSINLCPNERYAFQWFRNNAVIPGATNSFLEFAPAQLTNNGVYHAVLSNAVSTVESRHATLTVLECAPRLTISPGSNSVSVSWTCYGTLQVCPSLGGPPENWSDIVTQTNRFTINLVGNALFFRIRP